MAEPKKADENEINAKAEADAKASLDAAKEMSKDGESADASSLPTPIKELKGTAMEETVKIWARQSKGGQIQICNKAGCYYPLNPMRDPGNSMDPKVVWGVDDKGEKVKLGIHGLCSYAGDVHGVQVIKPPKKDDEL